MWLAQYRLVAWLLVAAALFGGGCYAGMRWEKAAVLAEQLDRAKADAKRDADAAKQTADALAAYQQRVNDTNAKAVALQAERDTLARALDRQRKAYDALPKSPVSADCKLSPERLQQLQRTFDTAFGQAAPNTIITQPTMPATGSTGSR